jgi:hypothetical protein
MLRYEIYEYALKHIASNGQVGPQWTAQFVLTLRDRYRFDSETVEKFLFEALLFIAEDVADSESSAIAGFAMEVGSNV